jgi:hypothetical protein
VSSVCVDVPLADARGDRGAYKHGVYGIGVLLVEADFEIGDLRAVQITVVSYRSRGRGVRGE